MWVVTYLRLGCLRVSPFFPTRWEALEYGDWLMELGYYRAQLVEMKDDDP